jgi:transcriptional regulator with XRE-family HTH domain
MPTKPRFSDLLRIYRSLTNLTQEELAALSAALVDQGITKGNLHRQHISRLEAGHVPRPDPRTIMILAETLAEGLHRAGYDEASAAELYTHLYNATRSKITTRDVSQHAAELDAILAPLTEIARDDIYEAFKASARTFIERYSERQRQRERQRSRND